MLKLLGAWLLASGITNLIRMKEVLTSETMENEDKIMFAVDTLVQGVAGICMLFL